mgnify:CR=1 FL=1
MRPAMMFPGLPDQGEPYFHNYNASWQGRLHTASTSLKICSIHENML